MINNYRYSKYFYKPRKKSKKILLISLILTVIIGTSVYSIFFVDFMAIGSKVTETYRILFNDFKFIEKNLDEGNFTVVINDGMPLLEKKPYNARLLRYLGEAYYNISFNLTGREKTESLLQSIRFLRKSFVVSKETAIIPRYYFILGMAYYYLNNPYYYDLAAKYLIEAYEKGYKDNKSFEVIALCFYRLKMYKKSIDYFKKAMEVSPKDVNRLFLASAYKEVGMYESALKELDYLIKNSKDDAIREEAYCQSAWIDFKEERYDEARNKLNKVLSMNSKSDYAHYWLGNIYEKEGDIIAARKEWRTALKINPRNIGAIKKLY